MSFTGAARRFAVSALCVAGLSAVIARPASAQVAVSGGLDVVNTYMFRSIQQNFAGAALWPWIDLGIPAYSGDGGLKGVNVNIGIWNSLHTANNPGLATKGHYELDFYTALTLSGSKAAFTTTYTSYTSPNDSFTHVKEIMFKLAVDDSAKWGLKPYATVAVEMGTSAFTGQADGGLGAGTYFELGMAPSIPIGRATLAITTKFGFSLKDYFESCITTGTVTRCSDSSFGYSSSGGIITVPLGEADTPGSHWNIHGGIEYQGLKHQVFGNTDQHKVIGSIGVGFAY
jgi:hypothetical protein